MDIATLIQSASTNSVCDHPAALTNFDGARYMGVWFEQYHVAGQFFEPDNSTCVQADYYGLQADGHFVVNNTLQDVNFGPRSGITGSGYCPDASGQCFVKFGPGEENSKPNYQVIDTDYETYSVVYACGFLHKFLWLLTRESVVSDDLINYMMTSAAEKLPNYDFTTLAPREYQGENCSYITPAEFYT